MKRLLKAEYRGVLPIGNVELNCAVLEDGTRVLSVSSVFKAFGRTNRGRMLKDPRRMRKLPVFMDAKNLKPFIDKNLMGVLNPIQYKDGKNRLDGYEYTILPKMCTVYLSARRDGALLSSQQHIASQSEILQSAFAEVGLAALIDEATGYQYSRKHDALRIILNKYIEKELQKWMKMFPDAFFIELDRLYKNPKTTSRNRPMYYGKFINSHIYEPLERGYVKTALDKLNIKDNNKRKARFHQWLTKEGKQQLTLQIGKTLGAMEISSNIRIFKDRVKRQSEPTLFPFDEL